MLRWVSGNTYKSRLGFDLSPPAFRVETLFPRTFTAFVEIPNTSIDSPLLVDDIDDHTPTRMHILISVLRSATTTPTECVFAFWEGWGDWADEPQVAGGRRLLRPQVPALSLDENSSIRYFVGTGDISEAEGLAHASLEPSIWWPADDAWMVRRHIDSNATYVGSMSRSTIAALLDAAGLDARDIDGAEQMSLPYAPELVEQPPTRLSRLRWWITSVALGLAHGRSRRGEVPGDGTLRRR